MLSEANTNFIFRSSQKLFPHFLSSSLAIRDLREKLEAFRFNFSYCFSPRPFFFRFHSPPPLTVVSRWWISQQLCRCVQKKEKRNEKSKIIQTEKSEKHNFFSSLPFLITFLAFVPRFFASSTTFHCLYVCRYCEKWMINSKFYSLHPTDLPTALCCLSRPSLRWKDSISLTLCGRLRKQIKRLKLLFLSYQH